MYQETCWVWALFEKLFHPRLVGYRSAAHCLWALRVLHIFETTAGRERRDKEKDPSVTNSSTFPALLLRIRLFFSLFWWGVLLAVFVTAGSEFGNNLFQRCFSFSKLNGKKGAGGSDWVEKKQSEDWKRPRDVVCAAINRPQATIALQELATWAD